MEWTNVVVAVITALGALLGTYLANRKSAALIEYRLQELEKKVHSYTNLNDRMYKAEHDISLQEEKIKVVNNRLKNIEGGKE